MINRYLQYSLLSRATSMKNSNLTLSVTCILFVSFLFNTVEAAPPCDNPRDFSGGDKIVGGKRAKIGYWPGQVVLRYKDNTNGTDSEIYFCGGSLISSNTVLTAAHCVKEFEKKGDLLHMRNMPVEVVISTEDLTQVPANSVRQAVSVDIREGYVSANTGNDIALIKLSSPWNGPTARLALNANADPTQNDKTPIIVAGFGVVHDKERLVQFNQNDGKPLLAGSDKLLEVSLPFVSEDICKKAYGDSILASQICAGFDLGGKDSCQGDSGGPLVAFDKYNCPYQVGVVSWGDGCAKENAYGVYTRISSYGAWIKDNVPAAKDVGESNLALKNRTADDVVGPVYNQLKSILSEARGHSTIDIQGGPKIAVGQKGVFEITSDITGRLIVIDINSNGEVVQLFPNKFSSERLISAGKKLVIPDNASYNFPARPPLGQSKLVAIIAPEGFNSEMAGAGEKGFAVQGSLETQPLPLNFFQNLIQRIRVSLGLDVKGFGVEPTTNSLSDWALTSTNYEIVTSGKPEEAYQEVEDSFTAGILMEPEEKAALPPGVKPRKLYSKGLDLTKHAEGFRKRLYNDAARYCTIGYGHLIKKVSCDGSESAGFLDGITEPEGSGILIHDMSRAEKAVQLAVTTKLTDGQFAALADFTFNVGGGNFRNSTILKRVNAEQFDKVAYEFRRWTKAGGKVWPGLVTRRDGEIELFFDGTKMVIPREAPLPSEEIDIRSGEALN